MGMLNVFPGRQLPHYTTFPRRHASEAKVVSHGATATIRAFFGTEFEHFLLGAVTR
jgi:hypothetical protein